MLNGDLEQIDLDFVSTLIPDDEMIDQLIVLVRSLDADGCPTFRTSVFSDGHADTILGMLDLAKGKLLHDYGMHDQWAEGYDYDDDD